MISIKTKTIAYLGDGKQAYNPVDIRVIRWWQDAIRTAVEKEIDVLYVLGNHDRVGQYTDADNWLPILRRAGARTFDTPTIVKTEEQNIFILPFSGVSEARRNIRTLLEKSKTKADKHKDILLFHHDLSGAKYNQQGSVSDASLSTSDIHTDSFRYCVGGHIHAPQTIEGNTYYVGSPFCHDFGEVNQRKRYLIVDKKGITSMESRIPRWYDPAVTGFKSAKPVKWKGASIRISVSCDASTDYGRRLEKARKHAEKRYKGADIFVSPKFKDSNDDSDASKIRLGDTDERKLKEYIKRKTTRCKYELRHLGILKYMLDKLSHFSTGLRTGSKVKFLYAKGKNFLPFKHVKTDFTQKGITLIQGVNKDRTGKSNGSGKTSLVQVLPVCMFGRTFKGQTADKWSNRWSVEEARAETVLRDYKNRKIKIVRGRHPPMLFMSVNGKDVSSGMKSNDKDGTQAQIEQVTGFTWSTLANAIYIDREVADAFLSGTKKQRTDVLNRFQNLERFEKALALVKQDSKENRSSILEGREAISGIRGSIKECKESINSLEAMSKAQVETAYAEYLKHKKALKLWQPNSKLFKQLEAKAEVLKHKYDKYNEKLREEENQHSVLLAVKDDTERYALKVTKLIKAKICPTCQQSVSKKWLRAEVHKADTKYRTAKKALNESHDRLTKYRLKVQLLDGDYSNIQRKLGKLENERLTLEGYKKTAQSQWMELSSDKHSSQAIIVKTTNKLKSLQKKKRHLKHKASKLRKESELYEYATEAFSRDGIPAFLNRQLCPVLNKAASYYAEIFSDNEIQVQFKVEEGEFIPQIINTKGGESIDDQSTGERALAGLIASFALREVAPRCNLLILDEPGEGLDAQTAKQFARALQKLTKRFGSIWIATHNVHILSELSGERTVTVVKENKFSKLKEN